AVNQAMGDLMSALDLSEQSNRRIIESCNDYTNKMTTLNAKMSDRLGLEGPKAAAIPEKNKPDSSALGSFLD
ncbi:tellurium resistance protein, partial [Bacillus velezensis]